MRRALAALALILPLGGQALWPAPTAGASTTSSMTPAPSVATPAPSTPSSVSAATLGEILFCSHRDRTDGMNGIYVMDADGSHVRVLSNTPGATDWMPTLSPDGTRIAFASNRVFKSAVGEIRLAIRSGVPLSAGVDGENDWCGAEESTRFQRLQSMRTL